MENQQLSLLKDTPVPKALLFLSIPSILTSLVTSLHNLIDTIYISHLENNAMIAATTLALPIMVLIQAFGDGIGVGSGSYLGRLLGADEKEQIDKTIATSMSMAFVVSIITFIFSLIALRPLLYLFSNDEMVIEYTHQYMQILVMFSFFSIFKQVLSYELKSGGDVNYPMFAIMISIGINIILNPIFMFDFGFGLKIKGAAIATVVSEAIASIMMMIRLVKNSSLIHWKFGNFSFDFRSFKQIILIGIPVAIRNGLPSLSYGLYAYSASFFGTDFLAAAGIARKAEYFARFVIMGIAQGYQPFASYNYGAKNKNRLIESMKLSMSFCVGYGIIMSILYLLFPHIIMNIMTQDTTLIHLGKNIVFGYAFSLPVIGIYQIIAGSFQAMGKGKLSFLSSILRQGLIYCPLVVILPYYFQEAGFIFVQPVCDWISVILICLLARNLFKEIKKMELKPKNQRI
ncbi:MAG: MATE family efflux transporter [Traorella sp.]